MPRRLVPGLVVCLYFLSAGVWAEEPAVKGSYFDSNGVKIHYVLLGKPDGEPVLLIHGFTLNIKAQWQPVIKALAQDYKVIAMDCRGHGDSEKPHDPKQYGLEMAKDAVRLLDHLKIDKAHIVGYSMGAGITFQIAAHNPERVRTATLGGGGMPLPERRKYMEAVADSLEQGKGIGPLIAALTPKDRPKPTDDQIKAINTIFMKGNDPKALAAVMRGNLNDKGLALSDEKIKAIKKPMLALIGEVDPVRPGVDELKKRLPDLKVVVIDRADHITAYGREEFVLALKEFLDEHRTGKK
ncbi:MAG TPA: alpha/beta hydrolase [Gemmataceae bacterium]|jgi:pimeloyl-ACP methyl ester carboxylesterase